MERWANSKPEPWVSPPLPSQQLTPTPTLFSFPTAQGRLGLYPPHSWHERLWKEVAADWSSQPGQTLTGMNRISPGVASGCVPIRAMNAVLLCVLCSLLSFARPLQSRKMPTSHLGESPWNTAGNVLWCGFLPFQLAGITCKLPLLFGLKWNERRRSFCLPNNQIKLLGRKYSVFSLLEKHFMRLIALFL